MSGVKSFTFITNFGICFAVCNQAFFLFADRISLLRLFLSRDADIEGCSPQSGVLSERQAHG